jgi:hypothetical protein
MNSRKDWSFDEILEKRDLVGSLNNDSIAIINSYGVRGGFYMPSS